MELKKLHYEKLNTVITSTKPPTIGHHTPSNPMSGNIGTEQTNGGKKW